MQLAVKDVSTLFGVSEKTVCDWIKHRNLLSHQVNGEHRFNPAELLEWASEHKISLSADIMEEPGQGEAPPPRLDDALRAGGICHHVSGADKASVLRKVVDMMQLPREIDRDFLYQVLLARESLGSTAIGDGIAIPHVRHPIVVHTPHPTVTLCFLEHPIDFGATDGKPVDILFTLVSPTVRAHQHMLSRLALALKDPLFRAVLTLKGPRDEILGEACRVETSISTRIHYSPS